MELIFLEFDGTEKKTFLLWNFLWRVLGICAKLGIIVYLSKNDRSFIQKSYLKKDLEITITVKIVNSDRIHQWIASFNCESPSTCLRYFVWFCETFESEIWAAHINSVPQTKAIFRLSPKIQKSEKKIRSLEQRIRIQNETLDNGDEGGWVSTIIFLSLAQQLLKFLVLWVIWC